MFRNVHAKAGACRTKRLGQERGRGACRVPEVERAVSKSGATRAIAGNAEQRRFERAGHGA